MGNERKSTNDLRHDTTKPSKTMPLSLDSSTSASTTQKSPASDTADLACMAVLTNKAPPHISEDTSGSVTNNANDTSSARVYGDRICTSLPNDRPLSVDSAEGAAKGASLEELTWSRAGDRRQGKHVERYWLECCMCEHLLMSNQEKCTKCPHESCDDCHAKRIGR